MQKFLLFVFCFFLIFQYVQAEIDMPIKEDLITRISKAQEPLVKDDIVVFTARKNARFVGIAFAFENYKIIHSFERYIMRDDEGKEIDSFLFYFLPLEKRTGAINYRLIIDGLWTSDPLNPQKLYDPNVNSIVSVFKIDRIIPPATEKTPSGFVRFVYEGNENENIRLAGTFNNWDSYMYTMQEVAKGMYQIDLPLPSGTYYYAFYKGTTSFTDSTNPSRAYTNDGRIVSILTVKN